jgi:DNA-binding transcriptional ArsR family regulator
MGTADLELASMLRALADPARVRVVELASDLDVAPPAMSKHLRVLLEAGIVVDERRPEDARVRVFWLRRESVASLRAWLDQLQAHWDEQLGSFKAHVERKGS